MNKYLKLSVASSGLAMLVGCAQLTPLSVPFTQTAPAAVNPCGTCAPESVYGIAVTRPDGCNDYPVTYRVQMPETDKRVRFVDRPEISSSTTQTSSVTSCAR